MFAWVPTRKWCSPRCNQDALNERRRERREAARQKVCERCGEHFRATRRDARFCSPGCRQAAFRRRVTAAAQT